MPTTGPLSWFLSVGDQVWSTETLSYFNSSDSLHYRVFLDSGGQPAPLETTNQLNQLLAESVIPAHLAHGVRVGSVSNPSLFAVYSLEPALIHQIGSLARDVGAGLGLPLGSPTFAFPDINGVMHILTEENVKDLYKGLRDYRTAFYVAVALRVDGKDCPLPTTPVLIP